MLAAGLLGGQRCTGVRAIGGAVVAAVSSLVLLAPTAPWPVSLLYQSSTGALAVLTAYGWPGTRAFAQLLMWFWLLNLMLAGAVLLPGVETNNGSVYLPLSPGALLTGAGAVYGILQGALHVLGHPDGDACFSAELVLTGAVLHVRAFHDTGFAVREPLSGRAVVLVRYQSVRSALPEELERYLERVFTGEPVLPPDAMKVRLVPCDTVAGHCLLPAVPAEELRCKCHGKTRVQRDLYAAFCDTPAPPSGWTILVGSETARVLSMP